jgi:hypothetical protein
VVSFAAQVKVTITDQITAILRLGFRPRLDFLYDDAPPEISGRWTAVRTMHEYGRDTAVGPRGAEHRGNDIGAVARQREIEGRRPLFASEPMDSDLSPGLKGFGKRSYTRRFAWL